MTITVNLATEELTITTRLCEPSEEQGFAPFLTIELVPRGIAAGADIMLKDSKTALAIAQALTRAAYALEPMEAAWRERQETKKQQAPPAAALSDEDIPL